jgi:hypothetical protein
MTRGLDPQNPATEVTTLKKEHRRGATVKITDYPLLGVMRRILNGDDTLPNVIKYASGVTPTAADDLTDKEYVDGVAVAGAPNASTTVKGIVEEATQAEIDADTAAGGTSARLAVNPSTLATSKYGTQLPSSSEKAALAGTAGTPGSTNQFVTKLAQVRSRVSTAFETAARFTSTLTGGGAATFTTDGVVLKASTAASVGSAALTFNVIATSATNAGDRLPFNNSPSFSATFATVQSTTLKGTFYTGIGAVTVASAGLTMTARHAGFKVIADATSIRLYATQADGTTENSSLLTTIAQANTLDVYLKINSTTSIDYYYSVDGAAWSSATNLTTNMPTGASTTGVLQVALTNDNNAVANTEVDVVGMTYER